MAGPHGLPLLVLELNLVLYIFQHHFTVLIHLAQYPVQDFHFLIEILQLDIGLFETSGFPALEDHHRLLVCLFSLAGQGKVALYFFPVVEDQFLQLMHLPAEHTDLSVHLAQVLLEVTDIPFEDCDRIHLYKYSCDRPHHTLVHVPDQVARLGINSHKDDGPQDRKCGHQPYSGCQCPHDKGCRLDRDHPDSPNERRQKNCTGNALRPLPKCLRFITVHVSHDLY